MRLLGFRDSGHEPLAPGGARDARAGLLREDPAGFGRLMERLCEGDPRLAPYAEPLARGEAVVVLSGQQPALLGGPLYTLYKTWTTIEAARRMRASGTPAVAAFWCVGDDTDHDEVRLASWPLRAGAPRRLRDDREAGGRRIGALEMERMAGALEALRADAPLVSGLTALDAAASSADLERIPRGRAEIAGRRRAASLRRWKRSGGARRFAVVAPIHGGRATRTGTRNQRARREDGRRG